MREMIKATDSVKRSSIVRVPLSVNLELRERARNVGMFLPDYIEAVLIDHVGGLSIKPEQQTRVDILVSLLKEMKIDDSETEQLFDKLLS